MKIKGIIFDLDGTLLDSMSIWENVDKEFLEENNAVYTKDVSDNVKKMTIYDSANYFKTRFSLEYSCEYIINRIEEMVSHKYNYEIPLKDGVYDTIKNLYEMKIKMCVATATYNNLALAALKRLKIYDMFDFIITCADVGKGKDDPEIFLKAAEKMNLSVLETAVLEDSLHCIETAKNAGFFTVGIYDPVAGEDWEKICEISDASFKNIKNILKLTEVSK